MLTAAIASGDATSYAQLLASLQQVGLISSIQQWTVHADKPPEVTGLIPDVILLDLGRDAAPFLTLAAQIRKMQPTVHIIACSVTFPPDQYLLMDAMRCGVQEFIAKPVLPDALREILNRFHEGHPQKRASEKLIVLMGSKGGVGTTTVAVNLGAQLCTFAKRRTVLLDFAQPLGNAHLLLDLHPRFGIRDALDNLERLDSHFFAGLLTRHESKLELLGGSLHPEEWQHHSGTSPRTGRERCAIRIRYGLDGHGLAVLFRLEFHFAVGANDSYGDGNQCAGALDAGSPFTSAGGNRSEYGSRPSHRQPLAQGRRGNA